MALLQTLRPALPEPTRSRQFATLLARQLHYDKQRYQTKAACPARLFNKSFAKA